MLRETTIVDVVLTFADHVMRATTIERLLELEQEATDVSYREKRLLYQKFEELESGHFINPIAHANSQFWMGGNAFICICPHCEQAIHSSDLTTQSIDENT